jgi:glycosyltransferase involved in cell wall biosynthesis
MKILIIVPAYNEAGSIKHVITNIKNNISNSDILVINDCSTDNTEEIAKSQNITVISLCNNLGIGGAMQTGYKYALENNYDVVVQIDGDGQHNPEFLNKLIEPIINNQCDICIGSRFINSESSSFKSSFYRRIGIKILRNLISTLIKQKITDPTSGFRSANKKVIELFSKNYPDDYPEPESLITLYNNNCTIKETPVEMNKRFMGKSSITSLDSVYYMIKVIIAILINKFKN